MELIQRKSLTNQAKTSVKIQFALMIVGIMDTVMLQTANATWDGKVQCVVNQSARMIVVDMVSVLSGVELIVLASANAPMDGQATIAARALSRRPCEVAQRIVWAMVFALMASVFAFEAIGDQTAATLCAVMYVSQVPNATCGVAPTIAIQKVCAWLGNVNVRGIQRQGLRAFPSCVGRDAMSSARWTATLRLASSAKVSAQISVGAGVLVCTQR